MNFVKDMGVNDHFQVSHLFFSEGLIGYALQNFIYVKFDKYDPSPYIFKKGDNNLAPSLSSKQRRDKILDRVT